MNFVTVNFKNEAVRNFVTALTALKRERHWSGAWGLSDKHALDINRELDAIGTDPDKLAKFKGERRSASFQAIYSAAVAIRQNHRVHKLEENLHRAVQEVLKAMKDRSFPTESVAFVTEQLMEADGMLRKSNRSNSSWSDRIDKNFALEACTALCERFEAIKLRISQILPQHAHYSHAAATYPVCFASDEGRVKLPIEYLFTDFENGIPFERFGGPFMFGGFLQDFMPGESMRSIEAGMGNGLFSDVFPPAMTDKAEVLRKLLVELAKTEKFIVHQNGNINDKKRELERCEASLAAARLVALGLRPKDNYRRETETSVRARIAETEGRLRRSESTVAAYAHHLWELRVDAVTALREVMSILEGQRFDAESLTRDIGSSRSPSHALMLLLYLVVASDQHLRTSGQLLDRPSPRSGKQKAPESTTQDLAMLEERYLQGRTTPVMSAR